MTYLSDQSINLLRQNARSIVRELGLLNDAYFEIGVTLAERHLLIELASSKEPLTAKDIAERLILDKSTVSRLVAKAIKKGFITCTTDQQDKRKRFLQFTELGKHTLSAFEPIAFNQTKNALQTLSFEEIEIACQGIALYAKGLKNSRLQHSTPTPLTKSIDNIDSAEGLQKKLLQLGYTVDTCSSEDKKALFAIFKEVVDSGCKFPYENSSAEEFQTRFFAPTSQIYVCRSIKGEVVGCFYLKSNYSGRSGHIANAAYMIKSSHRNLGIGTLLVKASLHIAKNLNFLAMQFNMVLSENTVAIKLYKKLGFEIIGTIPSAIQNTDGSFQDGYTMYRRIDNL